MRLSNNIRLFFKRLFFVILFGSMMIGAWAQGDPTDSLPPDPTAITVFTTQNLSFGAFSHGSSGGTVVVSNSGMRSVTGDVVPLNLGFNYFNAIFEVDTPLGSIISIMNGSDAILTGSNGGSMLLHIGNSDPPSPFVTVVPQPVRTQVNIGGTVTVGNASTNPPGTYTGVFYITFNQE
jgi:hypothetical protein